MEGGRKARKVEEWREGEEEGGRGMEGRGKGGMAETREDKKEDAVES